MYVWMYVRTYVCKNQYPPSSLNPTAPTTTRLVKLGFIHPPFPSSTIIPRRPASTILAFCRPLLSSQSQLPSGCAHPISGPSCLVPPGRGQTATINALAPKAPGLFRARGTCMCTATRSIGTCYVSHSQTCTYNCRPPGCQLRAVPVSQWYAHLVTALRCIRGRCK